ncbi:MAG: CPBP family intramembrane metalloprotease [Oscillospiraceae bacterium]|nr:CPBP family intramembrane metalloprotease [Oscillospiraceae bacterium]
MKKVFLNIWNVLCYPLLYIGVQVVVSVVYAFSFVISLAIQIGIENAGRGDLREQDFLGFIFSRLDFKIPVIISVFAAFLIMFLILRKQWKADRLWNFKNFGPVVLFCFGVGFAMNILTNCALTLLPLQDYSSPIDDIVGVNFVFDFCTFALAAPVLEEIIFRGVVQKRLVKMMNWHAAVILQAFIFGVIHFNLIQGAYAFVLGIFIGYIYYFYDSIWFACAIHISFNATSILLLYILGDAEVNLFYFMFVAIGFLAVSMASLVVFARNIKGSPKANRRYNRWYY